MKRFFDVLISGIGLILLSPLFIFIALWIKINSRGTVFFRQNRVGMNDIDFLLYKFRSMRSGSDKKGLITVGERDPRITNSGYYLRKYKLDELPQLINVFKGDMSMVGPRPEVRKYVEYYTESQMRILSVKPGITDYASIKFADENIILGQSDNPEKTYIEKIIPEKISLNMNYINNPSIAQYFKIIFITIHHIFTK